MTVQSHEQADEQRPDRLASLRVAVLMCLAVVAVYVPIPQEEGDNTMRGGDFHVVHSRRMAFALENLRERGTIPAWFPRELWGGPFWANVQSFPFIPTRLVLLPLPERHVYVAGVMLSAVLAAAFTFLYARAIGLTPLTAAAAGWTFACAGFFAVRVLSGQLPLLEAYPSLPLLLWLTELNLRPRSADATTPRRGRLALGGLAFASACVALAGHPQLAMYAFAVTGAYILWRGWGAWRNVVTTGLAIGAGIACAGFSLWPTVLLIGRSVRTMPLAHGVTDIVFPYGRLGALLFPWKDGWPPDVLPLKGRPFTGYDNEMYFVDTVTYVGWLPVLAAVLLVGRAIVLRRRLTRVAAFLAVAGVVALVTALPAFHPAGGSSLTLLRAPARQTYVTTFVLAMALGAAVHVGLRSRRTTTTTITATTTAMKPPTKAVVAGVTAVLLGGHVVDLTLHDRSFIRTTLVPPYAPTPLETQMKRTVGSERVAIDVNLSTPINRRFDDVGFFDSLLLARPYATFLDLLNAPPDHHTQNLNGALLRLDRLEEAGVRVVMSVTDRWDLKLLTRSGGAGVFLVPNPVPRATFLPEPAAVFLDRAEMHRRRRQRLFNPFTQVMLPGNGGGQDRSTAARAAAVPTLAPATQSSAAATTTTARPATRPARQKLAGELTAVEYERPNSDEILVRLRKDEPGYVRVMESYDPGWRAELNGQAVEVLPADDTFLAVKVPAGESRLRFTYHTPGATAGLAISAIGLLSAVGLVVFTGREGGGGYRTPASTSNVS